MKFSYLPYSIILKHQFSISYHSRKSTPAVLLKIFYEGYEGFGEAALPPYLEETQESVVNFFKQASKTYFEDITDLHSVSQTIDSIAPGNYSAKAAIDIAVHDLAGKILNKPCYALYNIKPGQLPFTSFTIGADAEEMIKQKIREADEFKILKIKLGTKHDKEIIKTIREVTGKPLYVDANQGWRDKKSALEMIEWLKGENVLLVEQPMPKEELDDLQWLKENSPLPIIADESVQRLNDIEKNINSFDGINIKLMKCGGIKEAYKMIMRAKEVGLKVMLGCMTETSCAISAALQLVPLADYADLDGNLLISNDPFFAQTVIEGRLNLSNKLGLGIEQKFNLPFIDIS